MSHPFRFALILACALLAACGSKGPLTLPPAKPQPAPTPTPTPSPNPAPIQPAPTQPAPTEPASATGGDSTQSQ